ncbi:MAG: hypothetical protein Ct9H300mP13_8010 [Gammaproteobacteria bacterium]|nr:MAG: hypothetical protein Ct9H300mP13_8010 [Gammaproteobacteria bacterium]
MALPLLPMLCLTEGVAMWFDYHAGFSRCTRTGRRTRPNNYGLIGTFEALIDVNYVLKCPNGLMRVVVLSNH